MNTAAPGYVVAKVEWLNDAERDQYQLLIKATLAPFGGEFLVRDPDPKQLEGEWAGGVVVIRFPSIALAERWYFSDEYRPALDLRLHGAKSVLLLTPSA